MDAKTDHPVTKHPLGALVTEGKTKKVFAIKGNADLVTVISKDDITAGDGAKHDIIPDKGRLATATTCNVFRLLKACGLPVGFEEQDGADLVRGAQVRDAALRGGGAARGARLLPQAQSAFRQGAIVPAADRRVLPQDQGQGLEGQTAGRRRSADELHGRRQGNPAFNPAKPILGQEPFLVLAAKDVFSRDEEWKSFAEMKRLARRAFLVLEKAWQLEGGTLVDFKVEFGFDTKGRLLLADVIDNDSWRVVDNGSYIDKQVYRDGGALDDVAAKYQRVAEITGRFHVPRQQIILWRGSESDKTEAFADALGSAQGDDDGGDLLGAQGAGGGGRTSCIAWRRRCPNSIMIAYIGRSNGAGPTLSAMSTVPVITVPASAKDFPEDVWSSLRAPSKVPVMTVLEPSNAVLAALQILSARNPRIYAHVREEIETRTVNVMRIS